MLLVEDAFGLKPPNRPAYLREIAINQRWRFLTSNQKVAAFQRWLTQRFGNVVLQEQLDEDNVYWKKYVEEGYEKGAGRAFDDTRKVGLVNTKERLDFYNGSKQEFLRSSFGRPEAIEKVKLLASRVLTDLKGVTQYVATRMSRTLTDGLVQGQGPRQIAATLTRDLGVGANRADVIARTEIIRAHSEGQLDALERLGVEQVGVAVEWSTAGDDRVCPLCQPMDGVVYKTKEAHNLIPRHPRCRCAFLPANVGESATGQLKRKAQIDAAMRKSVKAELGKKASKMTPAEQLRRSKWLGADQKVAKVRPESVIPPGGSLPTDTLSLPPDITKAGTKEELKRINDIAKRRSALNKKIKGGSATAEEIAEVARLKEEFSSITKALRERARGLDPIEPPVVKPPQIIQPPPPPKPAIIKPDPLPPPPDPIVTPPTIPTKPVPTPKPQIKPTVKRPTKAELLKADEDWEDYGTAETIKAISRGEQVKIGSTDVNGNTITAKYLEEALEEARILQLEASSNIVKSDEVWRGLVLPEGEDVAKLFKQGEVYKFDGLTAVARERELAEVYTDPQFIGADEGLGVLIRIRRKGGVIGYDRKVGDLPESILPHGSRYKITKVSKDASGNTIVEMFDDGQLNQLDNAVPTIPTVTPPPATVATPAPPVQLPGLPDNFKSLPLKDRINKHPELEDIHQKVMAARVQEKAINAAVSEVRQKQGEVNLLLDNISRTNRKLASAEITQEQRDAEIGKLLLQMEDKKSERDILVSKLEELRKVSNPKTDALRELVLNPDEQLQLNLSVKESTNKAINKRGLEAAKFLQSLTRKRENMHKTFTKLHTRKEKMRAFYRSDAYDEGVHVGKGVDSDTLVHELGHHLEHTLPDAQKMANQFVRMRTADTPRVDLQKISKSYKSDEYGNEDKWKKLFGEHAAYVGKTYGTGSTEIISMGVEYLYKNPTKMAEADPEFFKFIVGILRGSL
jgi:SPP1 gp7 family putative phage head morphogenesis protein